MSGAGLASGGVTRSSLQDAVDAADVAGSWSWDIPADRVRPDALVALLFNVDPAEAEKGAPLETFVSGIHPEDRERVAGMISDGVRTSGSFLSEFRVCSADGRIRWIISRGRFEKATAGVAPRGRGIIIDITRTRLDEEASDPAMHVPLETPLQRAAGSFLAGHKAIAEIEDQPLLRQVADLLLLEVGRVLGAQIENARRKRMN